MNLAAQAWDAASIERLRELLEPYADGSGNEDLRQFEWYLWWHRAHPSRILRDLTGHAGEIYTLAFSPDGKILASADVDGFADLGHDLGGRAARPADVRVERWVGGPRGLRRPVDRAYRIGTVP